MKNNLKVMDVYDYAYEILELHASRLNPAFIDELGESKIKVFPNVNIHRHLVEDIGGSAYQLVDANTKKERGVSDFDGNVLPKDTVLIITHIRVGYKTDANAGMEAKLKYDAKLPISFRNGKLKITQQGSKLQSYPFTDLQNPHTGRNVSDDYVELDIPLVIVGDQEFSFDIEFPRGAVASEDKDYLELSFKGLETTRSAA